MFVKRSRDLARLKALGSSKTEYTFDGPDSRLLEAFPRPAEMRVKGAWLQSVHIECPEFTSLCPKTGQPDFATIVIDYIPDQLCIESKSLKLYLMSYRDHGSFHEECCARISRDLVNLLHPHSLCLEGRFTPRGGIPFWPKVQYVKDTKLGSLKGVFQV